MRTLEMKFFHGSKGLVIMLFRLWPFKNIPIMLALGNVIFGTRCEMMIIFFVGRCVFCVKYEFDRSTFNIGVFDIFYVVFV